MSRYVVVGAGAVGALLAAQLHLAAVPVVLVARGDNHDAIRRRGLTIHRPDSTDTVLLSVVGGPDEIELAPDDVIVLATKTQDVEDVARDLAWRPVVGGGVAADLPLVTLQNGLAAEDTALRRFGRVYGGTLWIAASYLVPGEVVSPSFPVVGIAWIGPVGDASAAVAAAIARDFDAAGFRSRAVRDIRGVKAQKLLGNLSNALDLFAGTAEQLDEARGLIVAEATAAFAAASVVPVDPSIGSDVGYADLTLREVPGQIGGKRSTWQSFARGAGSEVDFLNGEIVLLGRVHGIGTPVNERVQRILGILAAAGEGARVQDVGQIIPVSASN
jgi:2-dehydropantoate 2-reductase